MRHACSCHQLALHILLMPTRFRATRLSAGTSPPLVPQCSRRVSPQRRLRCRGGRSCPRSVRPATTRPQPPRPGLRGQLSQRPSIPSDCPDAGGAGQTPAELLLPRPAPPCALCNRIGRTRRQPGVQQACADSADVARVLICADRCLQSHE